MGPGLSVFVFAAVAATPPVVSEMHDRFATLTAARDAVIRGDLEGAKREARWLTDLGAETDLPKTWRPYLANLNESSQLLAGSADLAAASKGVANAALACAECHAATGGGPSTDGQEGIPPQKWAPGQNMPLHRWAVDWMWVGLLTSDTQAWTRGASELDDQPLVPKFDGVADGGARELEQLVYVLAGKALTTTDPTDRAALLGDLVATCAQCHAKTRPLPAPATRGTP
jgi:cytochrome c553